MNHHISPIIGYHHAPLSQKFGAPRQPNLVALTSVIEMIAPYDTPAAFVGLESFSHIWISWQFHHNYINKEKQINKDNQLNDDSQLNKTDNSFFIILSSYIFFAGNISGNVSCSTKYIVLLTFFQSQDIFSGLFKFKNLNMQTFSF